MYHRIALATLLFLLLSCNGNQEPTETEGQRPATPAMPEPKSISYQLINAYPHDTAAFTQGFEIYQGKLLEGTGLINRSSLRRTDLKTGRILNRINIDSPYFGEGITVLRDTLYQLTWQNNMVFVYDAKTFRKIREMKWSDEGWGITNDGSNLYISTGSDKIYVARPSDLKLQRVISVSDPFGLLNNLNELEWINGFIYANRWEYDYILKIDPASGHVLGRIDLKDFLARNAKVDITYLGAPGSIGAQNGAYLNGIAYDSSSGNLFITGKLWPHVFEIKPAD
jgi:glutamine cyclotransferase